ATVDVGRDRVHRTTRQVRAVGPDPAVAVPDGVEADPVVVAELAEGLAGRRLGGLHAGPVVGVPDGVVLALGGCAAPGRGGGGRRLLDPLHQQGHVAVVAAPVDRDLVRARRVVDLAAGVVAADLDPVPPPVALVHLDVGVAGDRKSTRLNSSHVKISYAVFC